MSSFGQIEQGAHYCAGSVSMPSYNCTYICHLDKNGCNRAKTFMKKYVGLLMA